MHLLLDIHVEDRFHYLSQLNEGCRETLDEVSEELQEFGAKIIDHYLDDEKCNVTIDIFPESTYSLLIIKDSWLKFHIKNSI